MDKQLTEIVADYLSTFDEDDAYEEFMPRELRPLT